MIFVTQCIFLIWHYISKFISELYFMLHIQYFFKYFDFSIFIFLYPGFLLIRFWHFYFYHPYVFNFCFIIFILFFFSSLPGEFLSLGFKLTNISLAVYMLLIFLCHLLLHFYINIASSFFYYKFLFSHIANIFSYFLNYMHLAYFESLVHLYPFYSLFFF